MPFSVIFSSRLLPRTERLRTTTLCFACPFTPRRYTIGLAEGGSEKAADGSATATATVGGAAAGTAPTTYLAYAIPLLILLFALYWQFGQSAK